MSPPRVRTLASTLDARALRACRGGFLVLLLALASWAAGVAVARDGQSTARLDGRALFRVSAGPELAAEQRATRVEGRLATLLESPDALPFAVAAPSAEGWVVTVAGIPVVTVTPLDAEDNLTTPEVLARQ